MLDVTRLRVLAAVARHGSVTAAAKSLNYAQPSVSHHLARLEAETGTRLVERSGRGIKLTDAGRLLAGRAEEILGRLDAAEQELAAHVGQREERIRVAGFPSALATMVPAAAARLRAGYPDVELLLAEAEPQGALRMLRAGRVDVALVFSYLHRARPPGPGRVARQGTGRRPATRRTRRGSGPGCCSTSRSSWSPAPGRRSRRAPPGTSWPATPGTAGSPAANAAAPI
jgi:molybdate transport repressor ModE-like protein